MYAQKYGRPPCAASYPIIFHLNVSPNNVISIPGKPKSIFGSPANASGKNSNITYLSTVIRLLTITNNPPSLQVLLLPLSTFDSVFCYGYIPAHMQQHPDLLIQSHQGLLPAILSGYDALPHQMFFPLRLLLPDVLRRLHLKAHPVSDPIPLHQDHHSQLHE